MNLNSILRHAVSLHGDRPAVLCGGKWTTYAQTAERAARVAAAITSFGAGEGGRVAALLPNCREFLELYFAAPLARSILVPLNFRLSPCELARLIDHSGSSVLFAHESLAAIAAEAASIARAAPAIVGVGSWPEGVLSATWEGIAGPDSKFIPVRCAEPGLSDPAQIYYTSGTTGRPKGVILTHGNVTHHALMAIAEIGIDDRDTWLHAAPMFHLADAWASFAVTWAGGKHVMSPSFFPVAVLDLMRSQGVTLTNLVPTMLNSIVSDPAANGGGFESMRLILSGGAPISPDLVRRIMSVFPCEYWQTYGLTETSPYLTISKPKAAFDPLPESERFRYRSCTGRPLAGVELRVVDDSGSDVPSDRKTVGEILVRGPSVTPGYWNDKETTTAAFRDGWFCTGDLAVADPEGYIDIVDRAKDVIVTGGEKVFSVEVEKALCSHPAVAETAVVGVPDEKWGEAVKAVVVLRQGRAATASELIGHCKEMIASFKAPKSVEFVDSLPRTGSGKICKREIRERYWAGMEKRVN